MRSSPEGIVADEPGHFGGPFVGQLAVKVRREVVEVARPQLRRGDADENALGQVVGGSRGGPGIQGGLDGRHLAMGLSPGGIVPEKPPDLGRTRGRKLPVQVGGQVVEVGLSKFLGHVLSSVEASPPGAEASENVVDMLPSTPPDRTGQTVGPSSARYGPRRPCRPSAALASVDITRPGRGGFAGKYEYLHEDCTGGRERCHFSRTYRFRADRRLLRARLRRLLTAMVEHSRMAAISS